MAPQFFKRKIPMNRYFSYIKYVLIVSCLIISASGCSKKPKPDERGHKELLEEALHDLSRSNLPRAIVILQTIKDRYPYTDSANIAALKLADSYYEISEYDAAYDLYDEFERYHPKDSNLPYIKYKKGMCHFTQIRGFDRDQTHTLKAKEEFEKLITQIPDNQYTVKARRYLRECLLKLAQFEIYTGNYYYRLKMYASALKRYTYAIENYPDVGQYHEAILKIGEIKSKMNKKKEVKPRE